MKRYIIYLLSIIVLISCSKEQDTITNNGVNYSPKFYAEIDNTLTRTYVNDALKVCWNKNDRLSVFTSTENQLYQFDGNTGDSEGTFSKVESYSSSTGASLSVDANYAVYPHSEETIIASDGTLTFDLPQNQVYAPNSFGINSNPMIAVTENKNDTYLSFKNICGYLKLSLYGNSITAKTIRLTGNSNERISGKANVSMSYGQEPVISFADDASSSITLDCKDGVHIGESESDATEFWFVLPPITFESGFTIIVEDDNGNKYTKKTENKIEIKRSIVNNMTVSKIEELFYGYNYLTGDYLEGWDAGYFDSNNCFIVCRKEVDGGYYAYIGQKDKLNDGITLKFDENFDIQFVYSNKGILNVWKDESSQQKYATLTIGNEVYVITVNQLNKSITKSPLSAYQALNIICKWTNDALTMKDISSLFENGNDYLPTFIASTVLGACFTIALGPVWGLGIGLGLSYLEQRYEDDYYRLLNDYMGSPMIYISSIIDKNAPNYKVEVQIEGLDDMGKPIGTSIHTGIAVREDESNVNYENCDYTLQDHEVQLNESYYYANIEVETKKYYYLRPYTIVMVNGFPFMRNKYLWGGGQEPLVSYGDVQKIYFEINASVRTGNITNTTDKSAIVKCSYYNVNGIRDIECGVFVENIDTGEIMKILTTSSDGEREIHISGLTPETSYKCWAFINVNGEYINGQVKSFTTDPEPLPDLSGTWTFNQDCCAEKSIQLTLKHYDSDDNWAIYRGGWVSVPIYVHVYSNRECFVEVGDHHSWTCGHGKMNENFTHASGTTQTYQIPNYPIVYEKPWTLVKN